MPHELTVSRTSIGRPGRPAGLTLYPPDESGLGGLISNIPYLMLVTDGSHQMVYRLALMPPISVCL